MVVLYDSELERTYEWEENPLVELLKRESNESNTENVLFYVYYKNSFDKRVTVT
jgi:hypothetical protein